MVITKNFRTAPLPLRTIKKMQVIQNLHLYFSILYLFLFNYHFAFILTTFTGNLNKINALCIAWNGYRYA